MTASNSQPRSWQEHDPRHLLDKEAPRYTSYPSAHHFQSLDGQVHRDWLGRLSPYDSLGLYIHIPFCAEMCWFCGCNTQVTRRYEPVAAYIDRLVDEIAAASRTMVFRPRVHSLHFGGGSPGMVHPHDMSLLFEALHDRFDILPQAEISIELDPRRVTRPMADFYGDIGFNRVSLGVQDTQPRVQAAINRVQPMPMIRDCVASLQAAGIEGLGLDLVYGLPYQDADAFAATLADVLELQPDRLSGFSYAHVPWARKHQRLIDAEALPGIEAKLALFDDMTEVLTRAGYTAIGIDHFARSSDGLARALRDHRLRRNFMGYTDQPNDRLLAFGASAISQFDQGMAQNASQATTYERLVATDGLATARGWAYRDDDRVRNAVIADLMCYFEADVGAILEQHDLAADAFDADIARLKPYVELGVAEVTGRCVRLVSPMKMLVRNLCTVFDRYMSGEGDGVARYSRVA